MSHFRVMQFNMQFGQSWDEAAPDAAPINLGGTIAEVRKHNPDILLLQEVEHAASDGTQPPMPPNYTRLREELGGEYDSHVAMPKPDSRELPFGVGLAIFSRTALSDLKRTDLPSPLIHFDFFGQDKTPTDRLLIGTSTVIGGRKLQIFNTHLLAFFMLKSSSREHPQQRAIIVDMLKRSEGPTIIGGDFNISHHESLVNQMAGAGYSTVQQSQITWRRMPFVLDHLFYNSQLRCVGHAVAPTMASDHHVLVADFELE
ncbi:MAG: endonuclease/exonuclease/phosphatase family protein [Opitutaceae bacterium]|jgi:endonuclease/exonuclease/phosphatase family metal-dependent hydrolase